MTMVSHGLPVVGLSPREVRGWERNLGVGIAVCRIIFREKNNALYVMYKEAEFLVCTVSSRQLCTGSSA